MLKASDDEKRIITGVALIPSKQIYRFDEQMGEYYIFFSKETIEKASQLFLKESNQNNATYEHAYDFDGGVVVESWLVSDPNKLSKEEMLVEKLKDIINGKNT